MLVRANSSPARVSGDDQGEGSVYTFLRLKLTHMYREPVLTLILRLLFFIHKENQLLKLKEKETWIKTLLKLIDLKIQLMEIKNLLLNQKL